MEELKHEFGTSVAAKASVWHKKMGLNLTGVSEEALHNCSDRRKGKVTARYVAPSPSLIIK